MKDLTWFLKRMIPMIIAVIGIVNESSFIMCLAIFLSEYLILEGVSKDESDH